MMIKNTLFYLKKVWNLSTIDLAEIARNSVLQCSFEETLKKHWIGPNYHPNRLDGNGIFIN